MVGIICLFPANTPVANMLKTIVRLLFPLHGKEEVVARSRPVDYPIKRLPHFDIVEQRPDTHPFFYRQSLDRRPAAVPFSR